MMANHWS